MLNKDATEKKKEVEISDLIINPNMLHWLKNALKLQGPGKRSTSASFCYYLPWLLEIQQQNSSDDSNFEK